MNIVTDTLASVKFALTVVVLVAIASVVGTLLPQGADVSVYLDRHPEAMVRMEWLGRLGLTHLFSSWWFLGLLCLLAASVAVCSVRRFATVRRTTGYARGRAFGSMTAHISILLILTGAVIRGVWGVRGVMELRKGETTAQFLTERGTRTLPFAIHLRDFTVERYGDKPSESQREQLVVTWPARKIKAAFPIQLNVEQTLAPRGETPTAENSFRIKILKYIPDFVVDMTTREVTSRSDQPNNPAILVAVSGPNYHNQRWVFAKFPDFSRHSAMGPAGDPEPLEMAYQNNVAVENAGAGSIKAFKSTLQVVENGSVVRQKTIEVNAPLFHKGWRFYQSGYNPQDLSWTSLQVVRDPGVPVVYAGFSLMIVGLAIVFYINPWLDTRRNRSTPS